MSIYNNKRLEISKINKNILKLSEGKIKENLEKKITEIKNEANYLLEQFVNNKKLKKI